MSISRLKTLINVAKSQSGIDDDTYRAKLVAVTGLKSLREMSPRQLQDVLDSFKQSGFKIKHSPRAPRVQPNSIGKAKTGEIEKIRAIWNVMFDHGFVSDCSESSLNRYVERMTAKANGGIGVAEVGWLDAKRATDVLESLKQWHLRVIKNALRERNIAFPLTNKMNPFRSYEPFAVLYQQIVTSDNYMNSLIGSGKNLIKYLCPCCGFIRLVAAAECTGELKESVVCCPACSCTFKIWASPINVKTSLLFVRGKKA